MKHMNTLIQTSIERPQKDLLTRSARTSASALVLIAFALARVALLPEAQAVSPPPTGGYPTGNTAAGDDALFSLTTGGNFNTAIGRRALYSNTTGEQNTANGAFALDSNTTAPFNAATGVFALRSNTTGWQNTANGAGALRSNTTADNNTATGAAALQNNTTGIWNTADGSFALSSNTSGNYNIALGINAGSSLTTGNFNIDIGNAGVAGEANTIRIGWAGIQTAVYIAGIAGVTVTGDPVVIDGSGRLGTVDISDSTGPAGAAR